MREEEKKKREKRERKMKKKLRKKKKKIHIHNQTDTLRQHWDSEKYEERCKQNNIIKKK